MRGLAYPQVITAAAASAASPSTAQVDVADSLHEPWAIVALEVSAAIAATLVDQGGERGRLSSPLTCSDGWRAAARR